MRGHRIYSHTHTFNTGVVLRRHTGQGQAAFGLIAISAISWVSQKLFVR